MGQNNYKVGQLKNYKVGQVLQSGAKNLQSGAGITKWGITIDYYTNRLIYNWTDETC